MKTQFTPIAMRCTEEQFNAVKPKLKNCQLKDISDWKQYNYLVNDYLEIEKVISNLSLSIIKRSSRPVYETWDEKIFLEACGIEVDETFSITKSRILEISKKNTISQIVMKKVFPEAFEEEKKSFLTEGSYWFRSTGDLVLVLEVANPETGIIKCKHIDNNTAHYAFHSVKSLFKEATSEEVSEALKKEALKRGFKLGVFIKRDFDNIPIIFIKELLYDSYFTYDKHEDILFLNNYKIYSKGNWAEIIPTKTIEQAEKELNCKII